MVNRYRGEISAQLDGVKQSLCLTLGALAELEDAFGEQDLLSLAERFSSGRIKANDAMRIIAAGLRGAGTDIRDEDVGKMKVEGGAAGYIDIVAQLLTATFGGAKGPSSASAGPHKKNTSRAPEKTAAAPGK